MESVSLIFIFTVFVAGIFSFFSPCILPVIPVYIGLLSSEKAGGAISVKKKYVKIGAFILGLSVSFFIMGFGAGALGSVLNHNIFFIGCGVVVVTLGLHQTGLINITILNRQKTLSDGYKPKEGIISAFLLGFLFSFGWTPCVGPVLGAVLGVTSQQGNALTGGMLLVVYSLGLGIPFVLLAFGAKYLLSKVKKIYPYMPIIKTCGGILIVLMGFWMIFNQVRAIQAVNHATVPGISTEAGQNLPGIDFKLNDINGKTVSLSDFKGKKVYVKFWGTWCPSCLGGLDNFKALVKQYKGAEDVAILSIVAPGFRGEMNKEEFIKWAKGQHIDFPVLLDETDSVNKAFQIKGYPNAISINKDGTLYKKTTGDRSNEDITQLLSQME